MKPTFLNNYDSILHPIKNIRLFFRYVKWACQRVRRGYSDYDVWEIDTWFTMIVPDMLRDLKNCQDSFPGILELHFFEEHKEEIGLSSFREFSIFTSSPEGDGWYDRMWAECRQKWNGILDEMRFLFLEANKETCSKKEDEAGGYEKLTEYRKECREKAFALFCEWFEWLWD